MIKVYVLLVCFSLTSLVLQAQFNDSTFYLLKYSGTGIFNKTTENSIYTLSNGVRFSVSKKTIALNSNFGHVYGRQKERLTNNDFSGNMDFNWFRNYSQFYYWGLLTYESSFSLKVNNRTQIGLGGAYTFVENDAAYVNVSNGILYEFADLKVTDSTNDVYSTFRNSFRLKHRFTFNKRIVFDGSYFIQNALKNNSDYILNANAGLSFKLMEWLSLTSNVRYNKVNRNDRENLLLTFGLNVEKYF